MAVVASRARTSSATVFPGRLAICDYLSKLTLGAGKAVVDAPDSLGLPETIADDDCDAIAHRKATCGVCARNYDRTLISAVPEAFGTARESQGSMRLTWPCSLA